MINDNEDSSPTEGRECVPLLANWDYFLETLVQVDRHLNRKCLAGINLSAVSLGMIAVAMVRSGNKSNHHVVLFCLRKALKAFGLKPAEVLEVGTDTDLLNGGHDGDLEEIVERLVNATDEGRVYLTEELWEHIVNAAWDAATEIYRADCLRDYRDKQ